MMEVKGVESGMAGETGQGGLFQGMSFWLSHNVPQRSRFKEQIQVRPQSLSHDLH